MQVDFDMDLQVRCVRCGTERELPDGNAERVLEGSDGLYADTKDPCEVCGQRRIRVAVKVIDGPEAGRT